MTIQPEFNINTLVKHKFSRLSYNNDVDMYSFFEVIEILSITCSGGTQIFYDCRGFSYVNKKAYLGKGEKPEIVDIGFSIKPREMSVFRFREDELIQLPKNEIDFVTGVTDEIK